MESKNIRLRSLFWVTFVFGIINVYAQVPQKFSYQTIIRNYKNTLVSNSLIGMRISIISGSATGTAVYSETHSVTSNENGLATIEIGAGKSTAGTFSEINWATGIYFIKTEIDPSGGKNYTIVGTSQLLSVPYALSSGDNKWETSTSDISKLDNINNVNSGNTGIGISNPQYKLHIGNSQNSVRFEGPAVANGTALSIGGFGKVEIDAPGIQGGRLKILENGNLGIGNANPNTPLSFPAKLGKKITLYPGATGDVGFGVASNRLQIFSDNPVADVAIGYDVAGTFNERFAVKPSGALAINNNVGTYGQILTSGGSGSAFWSSPDDIIKPIVLSPTTSKTITNLNEPIQGATMNFSLPTAGKLVLWPITRSTMACLNPVDACTSVWQLKTYLDSSDSHTAFIQVQTQVTQPDYDQSVGPIVFNMSAGNHTIQFHGILITVPALVYVSVSAYAQFIPD